MNLRSIHAFVNQQLFVLGIGLVILVAWIAPEMGREGGLLPVRRIEAVGIFVVFFLQGLSLPFEELRRGAAHWKLHSAIQGTTFVFFPVFTGGLLYLFAGFFSDPSLRAGFLYLSFVPTTIASALTYTIAAKGNASGALFNTTLSNGAGVFLVPLFCLLFIDQGGGSLDVRPVLLGILWKILLPLLLGQLCRSVLADWAKRNRPLIKRVSNGVILFMIYSAFCDSFSREVWGNLEIALVWWVLGGVVLLFAASSGFCWMTGKWIRLDRPSRITLLLCGSQKTLAVGLPLAVMIFGGGKSHLELSLVLVPLLLYHPLQLVLGGLLLPHLAKFAEEDGRRR